MINLSIAEPENMLRPRLSVIGIGGAGGNAINNMIRSNLEGCEFIAANTDSQALAMSLAPRKIQLGVNLSRGLGAGSRPEIGRAAAEEQIAEIIALLEGSDMLFITAGMGGGTGTGAAPVIARAARESGILTVGVVTKPFQFEGNQRMRQAEAGLAELQQYVDTLIVIPNQNLFRIANERTTFAEAFRLADEVLHSGVRGITDLMVMPGFMNLDFADVKTVMGEMGKAMMGTGEAEGENRAIRAAEAAISNPLLDDISMRGARGVLINVTGGLDMTLFEMDQAASRIREEVDPEAQIKVGSTLGEDLEGRIRVSVIATGIDAAVAEQQRQKGTSAVKTSQETARKTQISAIPSAPAVKPVQQTTPMQAPAPVTAQTAASTSTFFTMPAAVTAQMVSQKQKEQTTVQEQPKEVLPEPAAQSFVQQPAVTPHTVVQTVMNEERERPRVVATVRAEQHAPQASSYSTPRVTVPQSPLRNLSSQQQAATPVAKSEPQRMEGEMRVTQIAATTSLQPQASHVGHRSQSLFQRITGFGMVRPSSAKEADEADILDDEGAQAKLGIDPADRPVLSGETQDMLDIPAFLRRQTNH